MTGRMTAARAKLILDFVAQYYGLRRRDCSESEWVGLKLSCKEAAAAKIVRQAKEIIGPITWTDTVNRAAARVGAAADAVTAAAAGEHNPQAAGEHNPAPDFDAAAEAEKGIRDWLDGQVALHQRQLKEAMLRTPRSKADVKLDGRIRAYSAAVIKLAGSLLDHLDAEAKQARADDAEDQAEIDRAEKGL